MNEGTRGKVRKRAGNVDKHIFAWLGSVKPGVDDEASDGDKRRRRRRTNTEAER